MIEFILTNIDLLGGIIVAIGLIVYAIVTRQWSVLKVAAYQLMLSAERLMATAEGKEKFETVFADLWKLVPVWLQKFTGPDKLKEKLQDWYDIAKDMLGMEADLQTIQRRLKNL